MIGYVCKYAPAKVLEVFDKDAVRIDPKIRTDTAESLVHPNMCSFMKAVLEEVLENNIDELVLTNCCDSMRRLYDVLKGKLQFLYMLDLPVKVNNTSNKIFYDEICSLISAYERYSGKEFDMDKFTELLKNHKEKSLPDAELIAVFGARLRPDVIDNIQKRSNIKVQNLTCTATDKYIKLKNLEDQDPILHYAKTLLNSFPCMRMAEERPEFLKDIKIKGIIYNTIKFCDFYSYEYAALKNLDVPTLKIETDYTDTDSGQIKTRVDAFLESLGSRRITGVNKEGKYFAGVDSGSTSTNIVILDNNKNIVSYSIVPTGAMAIDSAKKAYEIALKRAGLEKEDIANVVSTGYGRVGIPFADKQVTEITCHGKGAFYFDKDIRTIIDIGGQDSKVIRLDNEGNVVDFVMNDKCSAGTGKFLEVMARTLEVPIDEMAEVITDSGENIKITSMCTVFAESEVISLIAQNKDKKDIIHALNKAVASKGVVLLDRVGRKGKYMMTGGVAKNKGVVSEIENKIEDKIRIPTEPQIIGALGAAILALGD
ncbi:MAG TPA: 3-hydroxyacyl-ACP dehydratase [Thermoanaerobacterales bacterium]|nr:3-hydroxyacyl-ACP dehydratase [Thermoanaerobacterales bacterium]